MRDEDLRAEFDDWLRPVREAAPPGLPVIKRRLRHRRSRNAVAGVLAVGAAAGIAVTVQPLAAGPRPAARPQKTPATAPTAPAATTRPSPIQGGYQRSASFTISSPVSTLIVRDALGNVTVTGSRRSTVSVTVQMQYSTTPPTLTRDLAARRLTLAYTCPDESLCAASYDVQVPRGITVRAADDDGSIRLTSLAGPVAATSSLGDVTAAGLTSGTADFAVSDGNIDAAFTAVPVTIDAATALGTITIHVPGTTSYHLNLRTDLGTARVTVPEASSSPHSISAAAQMGVITITPEG